MSKDLPGSSAEHQSQEATAKASAPSKNHALNTGIILDTLFIHKKAQIQSVKTKPLGGWSNQNTQLTVTEKNGKKTLLFVKQIMPYSDCCTNRETEVNNLIVLSKHPFCPPLLWHNPQSTFQVFPFREGYRALQASDFKNPSAVKNVVSTLKELHNMHFDNTLHVEDRSLSVEKNLLQKKVTIHPNMITLGKMIGLIAKNLRQKTKLVASHNDTTPTNFMLGPKGDIQIVDFEHSANNLPAWDLAYLSVETSMNIEQEEALIKDYADGKTTDSALLHAQLSLLKLGVFHWIALWLELQAVEKNPNQTPDDFRDKSMYCLTKASLFVKQEAFQCASTKCLDPDVASNVLALSQALSPVT